MEDILYNIPHISKLWPLLIIEWNIDTNTFVETKRNNKKQGEFEKQNDGERKRSVFKLKDRSDDRMLKRSLLHISPYLKVKLSDEEKNEKWRKKNERKE